MPIFITPPVAQRDVQCQVSRMDVQNLSAVCQNTGTAYAQIRTIVLTRDNQELAKFEGGTYILPGSRRTNMPAARNCRSSVLVSLACSMPVSVRPWALRAR
jgi:P pilus assembly chaperone PapD